MRRVSVCVENRDLVIAYDGSRWGVGGRLRDEVCADIRIFTKARLRTCEEGAEVRPWHWKTSRRKNGCVHPEPQGMTFSNITGELSRLLRKCEDALLKKHDYQRKLHNQAYG